MNLTKRAIDRLAAPDPSGKQKLRWDDDLPGFGVLISGKTATKTFIVQQRLRDGSGKSRRVTIGATAALDIDEARALARRVIGDIFKGTDPKAGRAKKTAIPTPNAALELYLAERRDLAPATARMYRAAIKRLGPLAGRPLTAITVDDVAAARARARDTVAASRPYEGKAAAALSTTVLGTVWRWAARRNPDLPPNPVPMLSGRGYAVARRTGHIPIGRLADWYAATARLSPVWRDYLRVLLLTGMRRNEAAALAWSEVDFSIKVIRLPPERTKARREFVLPMSDLVHDLLVARRALGDARWVFPANSESGHVEEPKFALRAVRADCGVAVSAHDLRRTFLSVGLEAGVDLLKLKMLVNHAAGSDVTVGYIQVSMDALRAAAQAIADAMKQHCGIGTPEGVIPLSAKN
jgi:integrase